MPEINIEIVEIDKSEDNKPAHKSKSTGPKTAAGKQKSAQNAVIHGLTSKQPNLLANENPQAWLQHLDHFRVSYSPQNLTEQMLIDDLAWSRWLRQRLTAVMAAVINLRLIGKRWQLPPDSHVDPGYGKIAESIIENSGPDGAINTLNRYEARIQREFHRTLSTLLQLRRDAGCATALHPDTHGILWDLPAATLQPNPLLPSPASASREAGVENRSHPNPDRKQVGAASDPASASREAGVETGEAAAGNNPGVPAHTGSLLNSDSCLLPSSNSEFPNELPPLEEHPEYQELEDTLDTTLIPFPDARAAVCDALAALISRHQDRRKVA
jgi:hypothetical protein